VSGGPARGCGAARPRRSRHFSGFFFSHAFASAAVLKRWPVTANRASFTLPFHTAHDFQRASQCSAGGLSAASPLVGVAQQHRQRLRLLVRDDELQDRLLHDDAVDVVLAFEQAVDLAPLRLVVAAAGEAPDQFGHHRRVGRSLAALQQLADRGVGVGLWLVGQQLGRALAQHHGLVGLDDGGERLDQQLVGAFGQRGEAAVLVGH